MKILLIGPNHTYTGGAGTTFKVMLDELRTIGVPIDIISTARRTQDESEIWYSNCWLSLRVLLTALRRIRSSDVTTFHASLRAATLFGPILALVCRLLGRPFVLRLFGGAFDQQYERCSWARRGWFKIGCRSMSALLVETKMLYEYVSRRLPVNVVFFPNYTQASELPAAEVADCRRFIFAGRIILPKGIGEIIEAAKRLGGMVEVDIYGPIDRSAAALLRADRLPGNVRYCGNLSVEEIRRLMPRYHAQLLPSYYDSEGYPSAVLEGFAAGLPLIGTLWRALPELITSECGILIKPRDSVMLADAMQALCSDPVLFRRLRDGARQRGRLFSSREAMRRFYGICSDVGLGRPVRSNLSIEI